jgi:deoxycytidine triphosphate deaminase
MAQAPSPDLVWSGPEVSGLHARDTRRVCQLVFARMDRTALTPYSGKYQGQSRATGSLISLDTDR